MLLECHCYCIRLEATKSLAPTSRIQPKKINTRHLSFSDKHRFWCKCPSRAERSGRRKLESSSIVQKTRSSPLIGSILFTRWSVLMTSIRMQVATSDKDQSLKMHKKIQRKASRSTIWGGFSLGDFWKIVKCLSISRTVCHGFFCKESKRPNKEN